MFTDAKCPICGGTVTVELDAASARDASLRFQCSKCRETAIYDIAPEVEGFTDDFTAYLSEREKGEVQGRLLPDVREKAGERAMNVMIDNRIESCRDMCPYAEISADAEEYKSLGDTCSVLVTIKCVHSGICRYEDEGATSDGD